MQRRNKSNRRDEKGPSSRERERSSRTQRRSRSQSAMAMREGGKSKNTSRGEKKGGSRQRSRSLSVKQNGRDNNIGSKQEKCGPRSCSRSRSVRTKDGGNINKKSLRGRSLSWKQTPASNEWSPTLSHRLQQSLVADFHRFDSMMKHVVKCNSPLQSQSTRSKDKCINVPERTQKRPHDESRRVHPQSRDLSSSFRDVTRNSPLQLQSQSTRSKDKGTNVPERTQKRPHDEPRRVHPQSRALSSPPRLITSVEDAAASRSRRRESCMGMDIIQDAATSTSRLKELCMDIIQSAKEGTSPPQRAKIKEIVTQYHKSHHQATNPRDPNFIEIPPEYSRVLTYGLARLQTVQVQRSNVAAGFTRFDTNAISPGSQSRFAEIKDEE